MARATKANPNELNQAARVLAEHYQKTNELTYALREERDRFFVFLLVALAVATLFNFDATSSSSLLIAGAVKFLDIRDDKIREALQNSPILGFVQTLLLGAVFYLMSNLYQRTASVLRNFQYLGTMEYEIRERLDIQDTEVSFSREGGYYWRSRKDDGNSTSGNLALWVGRMRAFDLTKNFYTIFLALLLFISFAFRIKSDLETRNWIFAGVDALIGIPTFIYWWSYARVSQDLDKASTKGH